MWSLRAFSLAAALLVVGALGLLSMPSFSSGRIVVPAAVSRQSAWMVAVAAFAFADSVGRLPHSREELVDRGYLGCKGTDGWSRPLVYIAIDDSTAVIGSMGPNGEPGGGLFGSDDLLWLVRIRSENGAVIGRGDRGAFRRVFPADDERE